MEAQRHTPWGANAAFVAPLQGIQTYLTMLGASVLIPSVLVPAMGGSTKGGPELVEAAGWRWRQHACLAVCRAGLVQGAAPS